MQTTDTNKTTPTTSKRSRTPVPMNGVDTPTLFATYQPARDDAALRIFELSDAAASLEWDLDRVKELHEELTRQMSREVEPLRALRDGARTWRCGTSAPRSRAAAGHLTRGYAP